MILQTERLILRHCDYGDAEEIIKLVNSEGWLTFIGDRNVRDVPSACSYIDKIIESYQKHGFGLYSICLTENNVFIGLCGLLKRDYLLFPDIGYALMPAFQGKGYAIEACTGIVDHVRIKFELPKLMAITLPDNNKSISLLLKLGFTYQEKILPPNDVNELDLYQFNG